MEILFGILVCFVIAITIFMVVILWMLGKIISDLSSKLLQVSLIQRSDTFEAAVKVATTDIDKEKERNEESIEKVEEEIKRAEYEKTRELLEKKDEDPDDIWQDWIGIRS